MRGTFAPFFKHSIYYLTEIVTASFIFEILVWLLGGKRKKETNEETNKNKTKEWQQQSKVQATHQQMGHKEQQEQTRKYQNKLK